LKVNDLTVAKGVFEERVFTVTVSDGQLNLRFHDDGGTDSNWICNAIMIEPSSGSSGGGAFELKVYRGFACGGDDFFYGRYTGEHFRRIKQWGFNCLLVTIFWSADIEQSKSAFGVYNERNLQGLRRSVDLALSEGLKVILSGRVMYSAESTWDGWATHDYVNMQSEGLNRYAKFWEMMVQRFPDCMYCLWHAPYHKQDVDTARKTRFYNITMPTLIAAVRKHSNNTIVFAPIYQGSQYGVEGYYYQTATPLDDNNIIYAVGHQTPKKVEYDSNKWDYDYVELESIFKGIKRWRETYNLPMMSVEYFPLEWVRGQPIDQSRLDALEESLKRMKAYNVGWMYWRLSLVQYAGNILENINNFEPNTSIFTLLQKWM